MAFGFDKRRDGKIGPVSTKDVVGALFKAPNTVVGMTYGSLGQAAGEATDAMGLAKRPPRCNGVTALSSSRNTRLGA